MHPINVHKSVKEVLKWYLLWIRDTCSMFYWIKFHPLGVCGLSTQTWAELMVQEFLRAMSIVDFYLNKLLKIQWRIYNVQTTVTVGIGSLL